jgi:hypothetical protein
MLRKADVDEKIARNAAYKDFLLWVQNMEKCKIHKLKQKLEKLSEQIACNNEEKVKEMV